MTHLYPRSSPYTTRLECLDPWQGYHFGRGSQTLGLGEKIDLRSRQVLLRLLVVNHCSLVVYWELTRFLSHHCLTGPGRTKRVMSNVDLSLCPSSFIDFTLTGSMDWAYHQDIVTYNVIHYYAALKLLYTTIPVLMLHCVSSVRVSDRIHSILPVCRRTLTVTLVMGFDEFRKTHTRWPCL